MTFETLGLSAPLLRAVAAAGYTDPTPIQLAAIPPALAGRDVLGCAQTGTGKTAAFSLPLLQRLDTLVDNQPRVRALVVTPTRELASQIGENVAIYGQHLADLWHTVIFGGVNEKPQIDELRRGVDLVIATPGRLLDLMRQGHISLAHVAIFVLDEADRMLDMGFLPDVKRIVAALPQQRQTLFFSATMPPEIRALAQGLLRDPVSVAVTPVSSTAERIEQRLFHVDKGHKPALLEHVLRDTSIARALVFSRTKHGANKIAKFLEGRGVPSAAIHGNKSQGARTRALEGFKTGELRVLVATDLAARGIDVDGVTHVINYDVPNVPETYVHRIGRTARAGASGIAMSFCDGEERAFVRDIERLTGQRIPLVPDHPFVGLSAPTAALPELPRGPRPGARGGGPGRGAPAASDRPAGRRRGGRGGSKPASAPGARSSAPRR